jgi:hypothetical protein
VSAAGQVLWTFDTASAINALVAKPGKSAINSAPAVADLDGDGQVEVVVSVGAPASIAGYNGGMIVLDRNGHLKPGWPQLGADQIGPGMTNADGQLEGFWSSPALGDIDGDGKLEIVAGGWDMRIYAWRYDGRPLDGWPKFAYDTIWSSPVLADLDNDGRLEIIVGVDTGAKAGGFLDVLRGDGTEQPGFPKFIDQTIYASPAVADLNGDGRLDIVMGTGNFYPGRGYALYAWDASGNPLPGWPAATGGYMLSSPSVGDIDGDGHPEVVAGSNDGKVYAFHGDGRPVAGWPATTYDNLKPRPLNYASPVLASFDGSALPRVYINSQYCDTVVFDEHGNLLTDVGNQGRSGKPSMFMLSTWCLATTPAVADLDGDGRPEVIRAAGTYNAQTRVIGNAVLYVWKAPGKLTAAPWPMFRQNPAHQAAYQPGPRRDARIVSHTLPTMMAPGESRQVQVVVENTGTLTWPAGTAIHLGAPQDDGLTPNGRADLTPGVAVAPGQRKTFTFELRAPTQDGHYLTEWRMLGDDSGWFGLSAFSDVKVGNEPAYYVLSRQGGVYAGGMAQPLPAAAGQGQAYWNWPAAQGFAFMPDALGYELLDSQGGVWQSGSAPALGGHGFVPEAQELLLRADGTSYYILDRHGNLTLSAGAPVFSPLPPTSSSANVRSGALTADGKGLYLLLADGSLRTGGTAPALPGAALGGSIAKRLKLAPDGQGAYILDTYGRVWNTGAAPALKPNYAAHLGEDWARDFELTADGLGYYLLDKEGRIYTGGAAVAPTVNATPTWPGQDAAVDLAVTESSTQIAMTASPSKVSALVEPQMTRQVVVHIDSTSGAMPWRASADQAWLRLTPLGESTPGELVVTIDPSRAPMTNCQGFVTIVGTGATNSPLVIPVDLRIVKSIHAVSLPLISR